MITQRIIEVVPPPFPLLRFIFILWHENLPRASNIVSHFYKLKNGILQISPKCPNPQNVRNLYLNLYKEMIFVKELALSVEYFSIIHALI